MVTIHPNTMVANLSTGVTQRWIGTLKVSVSVADNGDCFFWIGVHKYRVHVTQVEQCSGKELRFES
jgi:hypothetical protein